MTAAESPGVAPAGESSQGAAPLRPPAYDDVRVGDELPPVRLRVRRGDVVRYAGASGDFNPIHYSPRAAAELGLPDVIAHGMLTMGQAAGVLTGWVLDPARIVEFSVRFANPVVVPDGPDRSGAPDQPGQPDDADDPDDTGGVTVTYTGRVAEKLDDGRVRVELSGSCGDTKTLGAARAIVRL